MIAKKRLLPILVAALMVFAMMPMSAGTVFAASGDPAMNPGTKVLGQNVNTSTAPTVWYAGKEWRVIGYDGKDGGAASESGTVTLLATGNLEQSAFDDSFRRSNVYSGSTLENKVNGILDSFSGSEQAVIKARTLVHGSLNTDEPWNTDCIAGDADLSDVLLWPLSTKEANAVNSDLCIVDPEHTGGTTSYWWLRSPGDDVDRAAIVNGYGFVLDLGINVFDTYGVRPAFNLNLESVLFTSAAVGGKYSTTGANALKAQSDLTNSGNEWKVTVKDNAHACFKISKVIPTENGVSIKYTGAATGTNEYISAIITDKPFTEADAAIKYYGRISTASAADDASVSINTMGKLGDNNHLYVFNEQYNGNKKTDYASELKEVTIPIQIAIPTGKTLTYSGEAQAGVDGGTGYTLSGTTSAANAGSYQATATLNEGYIWDDETSEPKTISWKIEKATVNVTAPAGKTFTYNGKAQTGVASGANYTLSGTVKATNAGSYTAKAALKINDNYTYRWPDGTTAAKTIKWTINKAANPLKIGAKTATVKFSKLKKKAQTLAVTKVITFTKQLKDKKTYTLVSAKKGSKSFKKYFKISKTTGKVTIKKNKKMKKGTYKVKVKIQALGNSNYKASAVKSVTFKVRVK